MEREQIIKALERVQSHGKSTAYNAFTTVTNALSLIKELTEENESLRKRIQHLCASEFIASFDEVDTKTKAYKKDITEADRIFKEYQCLEALYDPFPFCSISGCEAVRKGCHKTCPLGYENIVRIKAVKGMQERLKKELRSGNAIMDKSICDIIDQIAKEMLEGMVDDS